MVINYMLHGDYNVLLTVGLIKKDIVSISKSFPELKTSWERVKVELDLSNYATKSDLKNTASVDTSKFAKKVDLANLKSNADKLDIDIIKNVPTSLNSLKSKVDKMLLLI